MIYRNIEFQESVEAKYWSAKRSDDYNAFCIDSGKGNSTRKNSMPSSISDHIQNILKGAFVFNRQVLFQDFKVSRSSSKI